MATQWNFAGNIKGPQGTPGDEGPAGVSITGAEVNTSGDLVLTLSTGGTINAGRARGEPGGGIDFESSVATPGDLPATAPYGEARYAQSDGHLYVFEADGGGPGVDGWTDVGPIRGEVGATGGTGADGADGVSVTGAAIDGTGHLILTLSAGGPIDAGVARGATGADGADGATGPAGANGATIVPYNGTPPAATPYPVNSVAIDPNSGDVLVAV